VVQAWCGVDVLVLLGKTVLLRPYVFIFLAAFLLSGFVTMGRRRTLVFLISTWVIAYLSEFSSTRTGFPYGFYHYTGSTHGVELFIFEVPFMDSLSYTFLLFASFSMALFTISPLYVRGLNVQTLDTFEIRGSKRVLFLTALYMMMIDVVIDPVALQGEKWFLGKIYYYDYAGYYFGVPLSNALGWGLVGLVGTFAYQQWEKHWLGSGFCDRGLRNWPSRSLFGVGLYYGVLFFNLAVTAWISEWGLLIAGCFIFLIPTTLLIFRVFDLRVRATESEWQMFVKLLR
jgi:uncharacterized membrane protein